MYYEIDITEKLKKGLSPVDNLFLNMTAGLLPEHLSKDEISLLIDEYGDDWFEKLGYSEPEYIKPKF